MKKLIVLAVAAISLVGSLSLAHIEDTENELLTKECKALAQHILKARSQERLVKAQIKEASGAEKNSLEGKLGKIQVDIGASKEQFKLACTPEK